MSNTAKTDHPVTQVIADRWSPRSFLDRPVEKKKLLSVLEAARWAPSSAGVQPWSYFVATKDDPEEFEKMVSILLPANQAWASKAPVLLLSVTATVTDTGRENRFALHDLGAATALLTLEATSQGLQAHQMGGFDAEKARELYHLPTTVVPGSVIALGYVGDPEALIDAHKVREVAPRTRKPLSEFVFRGKFGELSPLTQT